MTKHRSIRKGTRVLGRFDKNSKYFGTVIKVVNEKFANVTFDDGDKCKNFEIKDLEIIAQETPKNAEDQSLHKKTQKRKIQHPIATKPHQFRSALALFAQK